MTIENDRRRGGARRSLAAALYCGLAVTAACMAPLVASLSKSGIAGALLLGLCAATGTFLWRTPARRGRLFLHVVLAFGAATLIAASLPPAIDEYSSISVIATGEKNPRSKSSEVWVSLESGFVNGHWPKADGVGWERRGDVFVSYQKQPAVLRYAGGWGDNAVLRIARSPYSGIAEVSIDGKASRFDLFDDKTTHINVPLPGGTASWRSHLQRATIVLGLGLLFAAVSMRLAVASSAWGAVLATAWLVGCGSVWLVHDRSYAGLLEIVAFDAVNELEKIELDAGHGFTPALVVPVKGGTTVTTVFTVQQPAEWKISIENGNLGALRDLDAGNEAQGAIKDVDDGGCVIARSRRCVYEVQGAAPRILLRFGGEISSVPLPPVTADGQRLFLLVERESGRILVSASRAYFRLSPWEHFSNRISRLRAVDESGHAAKRLVRVFTDSDLSAYRFATSEISEGAYRIPTADRADTKSFILMKIFAGVVGASFVFLIVAAYEIAFALAVCFRQGRKLQVVMPVAGCIGWLGVGILIGWPAIIGWDGFSPYIQSQTGSITLWYGLGYPLVIGGFLLLGSGWLISVWSALGTAVLLLGAAVLLLRRGAEAASWVPTLLLCAVLPFTAILVGMMTHLRDAMNGLMLAQFAFLCLCVSFKWKTLAEVQRRWMIAGLLIFGVILTLLRIDNVPTLLIVLTGLVFVVHGEVLRTFLLGVIAMSLWLGASWIVERYSMPDQAEVATEKRIYGSTAFINPLTGILAYGRRKISEELYSDIYRTLDEIMDVDMAIDRWSPYHIIYWHETSSRRGIPDVRVSNHLKGLYLQAFRANPLIFIKLRLATFGAMLGHAWMEPNKYKKNEHPSFNDHLISHALSWQHVAEIAGYSPKAHLLPKAVVKLLSWAEAFASTLPQLLVCITALFGFKRFPVTAIVAFSEITRAGIFFLFAPASVFLYLYDMHLLGFLIPMMALVEHAVRWDGRAGVRAS